MSRVPCPHCRSEFELRLIHNGFNDSSYAYCDQCGRTALLSGWDLGIPAASGFRVHERIASSVEPYLAPCECGGRFSATAPPRCPNCRGALDAEVLRGPIERGAPGTQQGWRWQGRWDGLYAVVLNDRVSNDPWRREESRPSEA